MILDNFEGDTTKNKKKALLILFSLKAALCIVISLVAFCTFRSKPKMPPSQAATVIRDDDILGTMRELWTNWQFKFLSFTHLFYYLSLDIMRKNLHEVVKIYNASICQSNEDNLNLWRTAGGILGWFTLGLFLYLTKYYKTANICIGIWSFISWVLIPFVLKTNLTYISILYFFIGFSTYTVTPFWLIYSVEVAYPLKETTVVGIVKGATGFISNSIAYGLYFYILNHGNENTWTVIVCILAVSTAIGLLFAIIIKPPKSKDVISGDICKFRSLFNQFSV